MPRVTYQLSHVDQAIIIRRTDYVSQQVVNWFEEPWFNIRVDTRVETSYT